MSTRRKNIPDQEFINAWMRFGTPQKVSEFFGLNVRKVYERRRSLEKKGHELPSFGSTNNNAQDTKFIIPEDRRVLHHKVDNGMVFVASDAHYWPGESSVAHLAFLKLLKEFKPTTIVMNGDVFDGARISRHEPLYRTNPPTVKQEIEACLDRLMEIKDASKNAKTFWTFGNHDVRLHRYIAVNAPELADSMDLFDFFPGWHTSWAVEVNESTVIKHRWHNGVHAAYNNALKSMLRLHHGSAAIVTGHLHRLMVSNWRGYAGTAYGVDCGSLADPKGEQFVYLEHNPTPWASGFAVLTFRNGQLLPPELCEVLDGVAYFRGQAV